MVFPIRSPGYYRKQNAEASAQTLEKATARGKHLVSKVTPISIQQASQYGKEAAVAGFVFCSILVILLEIPFFISSSVSK